MTGQCGEAALPIGVKDQGELPRPVTSTQEGLERSPCNLTARPRGKRAVVSRSFSCKLDLQKVKKVRPSQSSPLTPISATFGWDSQWTTSACLSQGRDDVENARHFEAPPMSTRSFSGSIPGAHCSRSDQTKSVQSTGSIMLLTETSVVID